MRWVGSILALAPALFGPPAAAQGQSVACFYEHANFQGRRMCVSTGQRVPLVDPLMNDHLSSVQVQPGLRVTMCEHANFGGRCIPVERSIANLVEIGLNDKVSSIAVEAAHIGPGGPGGRPQFDGPGRPREFGGPPAQRNFDDARKPLSELHLACDAGDRRSCIQFGIALGRNWERRNQWRQDNPEFFSWER